MLKFNKIIVFIFLSGFFNAVMDVISFRYEKSVFNSEKTESWVNPELSWKNKWEFDSSGEKVGEKFLGSSTIFVFTTDLWHLSKSLMLFFLFLSIILYSPIVNVNSKVVEIVLNYLILRLIYGLTFELFFAKILIK